MVSPRVKKLEMLGLGGSVGTDPKGIRAEVVVVTSFEDLANKSSQVFQLFQYVAKNLDNNLGSLFFERSFFCSSKRNLFKYYKKDHFTHTLAT